VETVAYRLPTRLEALAAAHMLRARGHSADIPVSPVADDASTLVIRTSRDALAHVLTMVERMFPAAQRCPDLPSSKWSDGVR
jgi:hypothetical protein